MEKCGYCKNNILYKTQCSECKEEICASHINGRKCYMCSIDKGVPVDPNLVAEMKNIIPEDFFDIFNKFIFENWNGKESIISEPLLVKNIAEKLEIEENRVSINNLLNVQEYYEKAGWKVKYYESERVINDSYFHFSK